MKYALWAAFLALPAAALAQQPSTTPMPPPPTGVYACFGQYGPAFPAMFGLLDARTYSDYDGKTGNYTYDRATGVLTMTTGGLAGTKYRRTGRPEDRPAFRMLDAKGQLTAYMCPREDNKDPRKRPW
jgi:hypothetical protein